MVEKNFQFEIKVNDTSDKITNDPYIIIWKVNIKCLKLFRPLYSAKNLLADVPKKFVTKVVIIREKLNNMLMEPRTSLPKVRATRKLNINGTIPINDRAKPV